METPALGYLTGVALLLLLAFLELAIIVMIVRGQIDLRDLIAEANGRASFSRFQFLLFTFVVAGLVLVLTLESGEFPKLGADVLALIGLSGGTYVLSKGIQLSSPNARRKGDDPTATSRGADSWREGAESDSGAAGSSIDTSRPTVAPSGSTLRAKKKFKIIGFGR